jgi:hypothetical protein
MRGAVCGAVASAVWALQQPLDKAAFKCRYDDVELLGKAVVRGERWYPVGLAVHVQNGVMFGAVYSNIAPLLPVAPVLRGPLVALFEHAVLWPLAALTDRYHPARDELPSLLGNKRAFAQATWRHLLFGVVLGELERRLNAEREPEPAPPEVEHSSNGRGSLRYAVSVEPAS